MKKVVQIVFGLAFLVFGINKFVGFLPAPEMNEDGMVFMSILMNSYLWPAMATIMILMGLSAIFNKYVALMLVVFAPIMVNIVFFHIFIDQNGLPLGLILFALYLYLFAHYGKSYELMVKPCSGMNCKIK